MSLQSGTAVKYISLLVYCVLLVSDRVSLDAVGILVLFCLSGTECLLTAYLLCSVGQGPGVFLDSICASLL